MLTKEFFTEIAGNPVDYHQMINKRLVREYYDYTSEYLFADCHCSLEEAKKVLNSQVYNNDKMFDVDDDFAKFLAVNNIEDVAKAVDKAILGFLDAENVKYSVITGSTKERSEAIMKIVGINNPVVQPVKNEEIKNDN